MSAYLNDLIDRMLDTTWPEGAISSEDTPSWKAMREAEQLTAPGLAAELMACIEAEEDIERRRKAYWILGKLCQNVGNQEALQYLVNRLESETLNSVLISILTGMEDVHKPAETCLAPVFNLIRQHKGEYQQSLDDDSHVQSAAILALKETNNPEVEPLLLEVCQTFEDSDDNRLWRCLYVLANIGTRQSIPQLERLASHKKTDISSIALHAILELGDQRELPIFECFIQEGRNKDLALYALTRLGNEAHIPLVIKRLKELLGKKRSEEVFIGDEGENTELMLGVKFLAQYQQASLDIQKLFALLADKKWDKLFACEKKLLTGLGLAPP
ncbi:hypothetical protein CO608_04065 [Lysobacteraceae bacterium NML08-0793]|nr:hypothetical protein CO608_04065 [Xanthomonadaceae bacterium NML08-0793]